MKIIYLTEDCMVAGKHYAAGDAVEVTESDAFGILQSGRGTTEAPKRVSAKAKAQAEEAAARAAETEARRAEEEAARKEAIEKWNASPDLQEEYEGNLTAYLAALSK